MDGAGACGVSKSMLGEERTEEWVGKKKKQASRVRGERISHGQNQGVNVSEHVL